VNLDSVFFLMRSAIPAMKDAGGGAIVVNASIAAFKAFPNHAAYCASKGALVALVRQAAVDVAPAIRVNAICPGPVDTPLLWDSAVAFPDPAAAVAAAGRKTLLKRLGRPDDVANAALFLATDQSGWMTGTAITIDGGIMTG
jgi:NAD(P)-dependent dehydrogenase (short-subunit alcohol dehydrogenase family)